MLSHAMDLDRVVFAGQPLERNTRIEIDRDECLGDGLCCDDAPGTFELDAEDKAVVIDPAGDPPEAVLEAAKGCPCDAIALIDPATDAKVWPET